MLFADLLIVLVYMTMRFLLFSNAAQHTMHPVQNWSFNKYNNANDVPFPAVNQKLGLLLPCQIRHTDSASHSDPSSVHL